MFAAPLVLAGCASGGAFQSVGSQATGSAYFTVSRPAVYKMANGLQLAGRVCRRARTTVLSPAGVRLEHIGPTGEVLGTARTHVAAIHRYADQPCAGYATHVDWTLADGDTLRACLDRGRACPAN